MEVHSNGGVDFRDLGRRFKAAGAHGAAVRKATTKAVQAKLKLIVAEQQRMARTMHVKGTGGRGSARREAYHGVRFKRAARGGHGLRETTARSIKSRVSYSGIRVGARIYVDKRVFPQSQQRLPRALNRPSGWRHPVWGNRERWVAQQGEPYFDQPIARHRDEVRRDVVKSVNEIMKELSK